MSSRRFGPKSPDHPSVGQPCPYCDIPFEPGDFTALVLVEPADAEEAGKQAAEHAKIAKQRESAILGQPGPSKEADCTDRELATLELIRHYRSGK